MGEEPHGTEWRPVMPFDCDDRQFTRGWQLGLLCGLLTGRREGASAPDQVYIYGESAEMLARIRERWPGAFEIEDLGVIDAGSREAPDGHLALTDEITADAGTDWLLVRIAPGS